MGELTEREIQTVITYLENAKRELEDNDDDAEERVQIDDILAKLARD